MNRPGEINALATLVQPDVAVITTIGPAHLGGLGSIDAIAEEKRTLLDHLRPGGLAVLNADHPFSAAHRRKHPNALFFGDASDAHYRLTGYGRDDAQNLWWFDVNNRYRCRLALPGRHNAVNALAAVAVAEHLGLKHCDIATGLSQVILPDMRMTRHDVGGIVVYNDAHNANPQSMHASMCAFLDVSAGAARRVLVVGDMFELGSAAAELHRTFAAELLAHDHAHELDQIILIGELMRHAADVLGARWAADRVIWHRALDAKAVRSIWKSLHEGDSVLLKASRGMALERILNERPKATPQPAAAVA
jgi:UDP-N-acetylmuramyl pentapeptide synthase